MKKVLCFLAFFVGILAVSQAQTLQYEVTNVSPNKWNWAMDDAGPSPAQYEFAILPGETRVGGVGSFAFPLDWKAQDGNGCYVSQTDFGPVLATTLPTTCGFTASVTYKVVEIIPFVQYIYKAELN